MKQGFLLLLCLSAITVAPSCRNKRNESKPMKDLDKSVNKTEKKAEKSMKKTKKELTKDYSSNKSAYKMDR